MPDWADRAEQADTPLNVLHELGGWSDYKMVLKICPFGTGISQNTLTVLMESLQIRLHTIR